MKLFQQFAPLVQEGVVFHLTLRKSGDKLQLEILPVCDSGKTGIAIPPRALVATPAELDAELPGFLDDYLRSGATLVEQISVAKSVMENAEVAAKEAIKTAATVKSSARDTSSSGSVRTTTGTTPKKRDVKAGLIDLDDDGDGVDQEESPQEDETGSSTSGQPDVEPVSDAAPAAAEANLFLF